jgi:ammonium transporter
MGNVSFVSQLAGSLTAVLFAVASGLVVYGALAKTVGIRMHEEDEYNGPDLAIHKDRGLSGGSYPLSGLFRFRPRHTAEGLVRRTFLYVSASFFVAKP